MPIIRNTGGTSDDSQHPFNDIESNSSITSISGIRTDVANSDRLDSSLSLTDIQGYYGLLTDFYFGGAATETVIDLENVNTWINVDINVASSGLFDNRPESMKSAQAIGHQGDGSQEDPIIFDLEGLDLRSFANFRASMAFEPEDDEGQLESRLLFNRHSGTSPSEDFSIEEVSLSMFNGADVNYVSEPMLSFFIGDTIDTNGVGDSGKCRFQIKSNVTGVIKLRALTWYINK